MKANTFYLDTDEGTITCQIIADLYSEKYNKNYLVYEQVDNKSDELYVSSYQPDGKTDELKDVSDANEIEEVAKLLEEYYGE